MAKRKQVAVKDQSSEIDTFLKKTFGGRTGTEDMDSSDITIPRIKIAQAMSEEVKAGDMKEGDIFLNITGEVLAESGEALDVIILLYSKQYLLWADRKDPSKEGIMARARSIRIDGRLVYGWDKPNQTFETKIGGLTKVKWKTDDYLVPEEGLDAWGSQVPGDADSGKAATVHHDYIVVLPKFDNMVAAFSLSKSQVKRAKDLNTALKMGNLPLCARKFTVITEQEKNDHGSFANIRFRPNGRVEDITALEAYANIQLGFEDTDWKVDDAQESNEQAF